MTGPHSTDGAACCYATMELLAKLEEEEGGQDLTREQLRGVILVLEVHLSMPERLVEGLVSIDTVTLVHRLAFSLPRCCPASRALERHSEPRAPTSHPPGVWLVSEAAQSPQPTPTCHLHPVRQRRRASGSADGRPGYEAEKASWRLRMVSKDTVRLLPASLPHHAHRWTRGHPSR